MKKATLDSIKKGSFITIISLPDGILKVQLIRLGLSEGTKVLCIERLPGGTIILKKNRQEIAVGYDLARQIIVIRNKNN